MVPELLNYLACPIDSHFPLSLNKQKVGAGGEIQTGSINCPACQNTYEIRESIPSFQTL